ncbi:TPA: hypothetical protein ACRZZI_004991 [Vibrio harveyi]
MKSNFSEQDTVEMFESYLNGNITYSINEFKNLSNDSKAQAVALLTEMHGAEKVISFIHKYLLMSE